MFNNPRPAQRYGASNSFGSSYVEDHGPLVASVYDNVDPWSANPTPSPPPIATGPSSALSTAITTATLPSVYHEALNSVDPTGLGEMSVNALSRVLGTSGLPAATVDRIVNLVSSRPKVSKLEFFVALALAAFAQSNQDLSVERVASLAAQNMLPEPSLDLSHIPPSNSEFVFKRDIEGPATYAPAPTYGTSDDPWNTPSTRIGGGVSVPGVPTESAPGSGFEAAAPVVNGTASSVAGTGLPKDWWRKQESIGVSVKGQQGFILKRYTVYEVTTSRGAPVQRRYSEFVFLWETLTRRYPFRLIPNLPPKRIGPDQEFIEQRRKGLARFLTFVLNHAVLREDGLLGAFLTEPSFDDWRRQSAVSTDEESATKRVDRAQEMSIPGDLEEKLALQRRKVPQLIDHWQKLCIFAERMIKRREAAASDASRMTNTLRALVEANHICWRGEDCELCAGVSKGLGKAANRLQTHADLLEQRSRSLLYSTLEAMKGQRDLYIALRDLFVRQDRLSGDQVERLKKRVETTSLKADGIKAARRDGWEVEVDRLHGAIEKDQAAITLQLHRRVFIRYCMWQELRVVLHNRENALVTQALRAFAHEEQDFGEQIARNWTALSEDVEDMPYE